MIKHLNFKILNLILKFKRYYTELKGLIMNEILLDSKGQPLPPKRPSTRKKVEKNEMDMWTRLKNPTGTIFLPEILKAVSKESLKEDKIKLLRIWTQRGTVIVGKGYTKNYELLCIFLECVYAPYLKFDLPDTKPPYKENEAKSYNDVSITLYTAIKKLKYFAENPDKITNRVKRENIYIQTLENLFVDEAELFFMMTSKKINNKVYPTLNKELFKEAFPNLNLWKTIG